MAKLTSEQRSRIMKKAWKERKPKAICSFCGHKIWSGGVKYLGRPFHKSCLESFKFGLTRKQAGVANPKRRTRDSYEFYGAKELNPRPPSVWWSRMWAKTAAAYPREAGETLKHYKAGISKITAGIWYNFSEVTRARLIKKYEKLGTTAKALTNLNIHSLLCPVCQHPNLVSKANVYLKCSNCGIPLRSVRIRKKGNAI